jgi:hypothetical protein
MTEPKPPLARVAERLAETAKEMVAESAAAMKDESVRIDADEYKLKDAIATVTRLVNVGISGATHIGRIAIEEKPPDTVLAMGEYIASVVRRMVGQTGVVAQDASIHVEHKDYTPSKWLESMTRLIDIGIAGGMEIVETVAAGPARFEVQPLRSDEFEAPAAPNGEVRTLVAGDDIKRDATDPPIANSKITFDPPTLVPPNTKFCVLVDASGLVSGVYEGTVHAVYAKKDAPDVTPDPDPVDVSIPL